LGVVEAERSNVSHWDERLLYHWRCHVSYDKRSRRLCVCDIDMRVVQVQMLSTKFLCISVLYISLLHITKNREGKRVKQLGRHSISRTLADVNLNQSSVATATLQDSRRCSHTSPLHDTSRFWQHSSLIASTLLDSPMVTHSWFEEALYQVQLEDVRSLSQ